MDFLVRVYEMKFEEFLTSCTCMKWSVKWFYEMQTLNIASQNFTIFHTISVLTFYEMVYETVWNSMKQFETVWNDSRIPSFITILLKVSVSFSSFLLQDSLCYGKRSSKSFCFSYSARTRHSSAEFPHPHVHLIQSAAIPRAFVSVSATMLHSWRPIKATWDRRMLISIHIAWNKRHSAQDMTKKSDVHYGFQCWKWSRLIEKDDFTHSMQRITVIQYHSLECWKKNEWDLESIFFRSNNAMISSNNVSFQSHFKDQFRPAKHHLIHVFNYVEFIRINVHVPVWQWRNCCKAFLETVWNSMKQYETVWNSMKHVLECVLTRLFLP